MKEELWQSIRELFENAEASTNDKLGKLPYTDIETKPRQGNDEQMTLGVVNELEDNEGSTAQSEKPIVHEVGHPTRTLLKMKMNL